MTSREWVIPRARSPDASQPLTRRRPGRKAQNRAAQRAFQGDEPRRVGELEEQLEEQKDEHDQLVRDLQERISHLELESQALQSRCQWLEGQLEQERMAKGTTGRNWEDDRQQPSSTGSESLGAQSTVLPRLPQPAQPDLAVSSPLETAKTKMRPASLSPRSYRPTKKWATPSTSAAARRFT